MEEERSQIFEVLAVDIDWSMDCENLILGCRAKVKVRIGNRIKLGFATSRDGQINAFDLALRRVVGEFFPEINEIRLTDYRVELAEGSKGTEAYVKVKIRIEYGEGASKESTEMEAIGSDLVATTIEAISSAYQYAIQQIISQRESIIA